MLSRLGVEEINKAAFIGQKSTMATATTSTLPPSWLSNLGDLIAEYLPTFLQIFNSLRTAEGRPTVAQFFARGNEMLNRSEQKPPA